MHKRLDLLLLLLLLLLVLLVGGFPFRFSSLLRENRNENDCIELNLHDSLTGPWRWKGEIVYRARVGKESG